MTISMDGHTELSSAAYPKVYRTALGWRLLLLTVGALGIGAALEAVFLLAASRLGGDGSPTRDLWLSLLTLVPLGLYAIASALRFRVILSVDRIELIQAFGRRQMLRTQIHGWRVLRNQYGMTLELVSRDRRADKLWISLVFKTDEIWREWYSTLTDLDTEEARTAEQELFERLYPHLAADERVWRIAPLRRLAAWVNVAAILLLVAALTVFPVRLTVLLCTLLPWVVLGLVARFQPLYGFTAPRDDPNPNLALSMVLPGLLMTFALTELHPLHPLDWRAPLILAGVLGLALTVAAARIDARARTVGMIYLLVITDAVYGYGAGLGWNALADLSTAQTYPVTVLSSHVYRGTRVSTWNLRLPPWGPVTNTGEVSVTPKLYWSTKPGDTVCVYLKHGAFRIPWYQIARCESLSP